MKLRDISKANPSYGCTARLSLKRGRPGERCEKRAVVLAIGVEVRAFCARHATRNCGDDWRERTGGAA